MAAWLHSSQIALPSDLAEVQPEPALDPAPRAESPARVSYPAGHRLRRRGWVLRRVLLLADAAGFVAAVALVDMFRADINFADPAVWAFGLGAFCAWVLFAHGYGLYLNDELQAVRPTADDVPGVILLVTLTTWVGVLVLDASQIATPRLGLTALFWAATIALLLTARAIARGVLSRRFVVRERTLIVGAGQVGSEIARKLGRRPEYGLEVIGFLDDEPLHDPLRAADQGPPQLGGTSRIEHVLEAYQVERVIFAFSRLPGDEQIELFQRCMELGVQVDIVPRLYEVIGSRMQVHDVEGLPLLGLRRAAPVALVAPAEAQPRHRALGGAARSCCAPLLALLRRCGSSSSRPARCSSARSGWAPAAGASGSSSSGRCTRTPRSGRPSWST